MRLGECENVCSVVMPAISTLMALSTLAPKILGKMKLR
jgi:hypothetical protein